MKTLPIWQRPAFWATLTLTCLTAIFVAAGTWQLQRARYKDGVQSELAQRAQEPIITLTATLLEARLLNLRRVKTQGRWATEKTILLDNKVRDGVVGYEVLTPLQIDATTHVLVNRGWVKAPLLRSEMPTIETPITRLTLSGVARIPSDRFIELGQQNVSGIVWQNLTMERYQAWSGLTLQPFVLYQNNNEPADGLVRVLPAPEAMGINADRHRGYALTWYLLAGVTVVLGLFAGHKAKGKI